MIFLYFLFLPFLFLFVHFLNFIFIIEMKIMLTNLIVFTVKFGVPEGSRGPPWGSMPWCNSPPPLGGGGGHPCHSIYATVAVCTAQHSTVATAMAKSWLVECLVRSQSTIIKLKMA
jgi:hypothetical protein